MSTENSSSMAEKPETIPSPNETPDTTVSEPSLREQLAAALKMDISDSPNSETVADVPADVQAETETVAETPADPAPEPPATWPADEKARFAQLPRETQDYLLLREKEREADYTRKTMEAAEARKSADELTRTLDPYKQQMELAGISPAQAIQRLLAAQRFLETNPQDAIKWLAQSFNVDLGSFAPKEEEAYTDPALKAMRDEVNQLKAQLNQRQQVEQQQSVSEVQKQINEFQGAKNEDGSLKYPHFEKLRTVMGPLVAQGKTMVEAYNETQYILPEVRERLQSENAKAAQSEALKKAEEARKAKAKDVRGNNQVIRSRGTASEDGGKPGTLRQELAKNLADLQSGRI